MAVLGEKPMAIDTRDTAGPDCRILEMRKYARGRDCLPTLSTAALPVA